MQRPIDAFTLAEEIESLSITVAGKPAKWYDAKHTVLRVIAEQPTIKTGPEWISVKDKGRKPETGERYLVVRYDYVTKTPFKDILWYDKGTWWNRQHGGDYAVTHWMPLPELPKEE